MTHQVGVWDQDSFAWYADTGGEGTGQIGSTNVNPTTLETGTNYRMRYLIQETAGSTEAETPVFGLEFRVDTAGGTNFGAWTVITSSNENFQTIDTSNVTDGATTTQQIGAGTFRDGEFSYVAGGTRAPTNVLTATAGNDEYEVEWVLQFSSTAANRNFEFRVVWDNGGTPVTATDTATNTTQVSPNPPNNALLANNISSATAVSTPAANEANPLLANNLQSATAVTTNVIGQTHVLLADNVQSASTTSTNALTQEHALLADNVQSATTVSTNVITIVRNLLADNVQSTSTVSTNTATLVHNLLANDVQSATTVSVPLFEESVEYLRPDGDNSVGSWTTHLNGTTNLYQMIDDDPADDADYIRSELNPTNSAVRVSLSNPIDVPDTAGSNIVRYRYRKDDVNGQQIDLTVRLIEGASTVIASWSHTNISATITQANQALTTPQKTSITNYDNLFLEFEANAP